jgi:very-short-patch-repair endonuclease
MRSGMPVLSPADTWSRLGTLLSHRELVVAGDYLVRKKRHLCTLAELTEAAAQDRRGIRAVRRALADVRERTESPKETELRLMIVAAGLPEPVVGYTVKDAKGDFVATPDLAYVKERIAIEYEGKQHFSDPRVYADDILRYELLEEAGWLVIRVIGADLGSRRTLALTRIRRALAARA